MSIIAPQRHLFDIPEEIAYFNCAYNSPQLNEAHNRLLAGIGEKNRPWQRTAASFFTDAETLRTLASELFGGDADGYAIIPAASYGLSAAARAIEPQLVKGDKILHIAEEFPSNVLPWQRTAGASGAALVTVQTPESGGWTQAVLQAIGPEVKVVTLSPCHWTNGAAIDLVAIGRACRRNGSMLVIDATQSLGAMPFAMEEVQPDFLVAAGYKWLLCPYGFGLMYVAASWRHARPLEETWLARDGAEDFTSLVNYSPTYMEGARRFDMGEKCTTILPGAIAALQQIKAWGIADIAETLATINGRIAEHLLRLGFHLPEAAERCPHMFGARLPEGFSSNLVNKLQQKNIFISQRGNALRFAPHLHVNDDDISRLLQALSLFVGQSAGF